MKNKFRSLNYFLVPYAVIAIVWFALILIYEKADLHLLLNTHHSPFLDALFTLVTEIGASLPVIIAVGLLFRRYKEAFYVGATLIANVLLTNGLKLLFREPRPIRYFAENYPDIQLHFVEGMRIHYNNGFPSGHTSAAFAAMMCIALMARNRYVSVLCLVAAIAAGYSRVYLSQHFAEDVMLGSLIGIATALAFYPFYTKTLNKQWMQGSLLTSFKKK